MTSYALIKSLPYTKAQQNFQNAIHPMAEQVVTVDKLYGYDALTHANENSNNSGYFTMQSGYGNNKKHIGYDKACTKGIVRRDLLGRATIFDPAVGPGQQPDCGCTKYKKRNCTGTMGHISCSGSIHSDPTLQPGASGKGSSNGVCPKNNSLCCYDGDMCNPRQIGEKGTCIAGRPYNAYDLKENYRNTNPRGTSPCQTCPDGKGGNPCCCTKDGYGCKCGPLAPGSDGTADFNCTGGKVCMSGGLYPPFTSECKTGP